MNFLELMAKLSLDSSDYENGIGKAKSSASKFGKGIGTAMKVGAAAITAVTTATTALTGVLIKGTGEVAAYGDAIDKESQKLGISAQAYQEWDAILQHTGGSIDNLKPAMKTLAKEAINNSDAFQQLGISQEEVANLSKEEIFQKTISALQQMPEGMERTRLATQLLGKSSVELGALLNTSAEETEAMRQRVHELGGVMSDDAVKASAKYQDQLQDMQTAFSGVKRGILSDFMPAITTVMGGLTELFSGGDGLGQISDGIGQFVDKIAENTPKILEVGTQIVLALGQAVTENLPVLLKAGTDAILMLGTGLIQQLPDIIAAGLEVILALAQGIAESLPELIPTIVDVVLQIVDTLTQPNTLSALIDASIAIIIALANGLIDALPKLLEKAPEIVANLMTALVENAPKLLQSAFELIKTLATGLVKNFPTILKKGAEIVTTIASGVANAARRMLEVGRQIVEGIWQGISNGLGWIKDKIRGWVGDLLGFFKRILKISSPSKVFRDQIGKFMALGIGQGFVDEMANVEKMMQNAMPDPYDFVGDFDLFDDFDPFGDAEYEYRTITTDDYATANNRADSELLRILRDIRDNMDTDLVLNDGTLIGWMDKALGRRAAQKARGNA